MFVVVSLVICLFEVGGVCEVYREIDGDNQRPAFPLRALYSFQPVGIRLPDYQTRSDSAVVKSFLILNSHSRIGLSPLFHGWFFI